jgi:hypothetical protein
MATIFRKTSKGVSEIATRANRLAPRLRSALILVDGTRGDAELSTLIGQNPVDTLQLLTEQGYIEIVTQVEPPPRPARPTADTSSAANADNAVAFQAFRAQAVRAFNELVGPSGDVLAIKMESTASREQLAPFLELASQIIGHSRGAQAAAEFRARFTTS